ncbi:MAG: radical SAM protein [Thermodesulfobacteriota bacterium]
MATVIFKPTEACNARCIYCDVVHKKPRPPVIMPLETLELFFSRINEFLLERREEGMEVIWHGGEPLLLGPDYFYQALHFQEKHCPETKSRIRHSIQSNLTRFSRDFTEVMKKLGITSFGSSYDPILNLRGLGKKRDSQAYNRKFMEGIRLVEEEGFGWGIIYVVTKPALAKPREIFHFLANFSPRGAFMFNPVLLYDAKLDYLKVTPEEYTDFLGAIFPAWWQHREEYPQVEPFSSLAGNLLEGGTSLMCCDSGSCARNHINVLPDGSLSLCGRAADWGLLQYGSIFDKSFAEALADPQREVLLERNQVLPDTECRGCRFWDICHGGCPLDAWSGSGSFLHKSEWCHAKRGFIEKYFEPTVNPGPAGGAAPVPEPSHPRPPSLPANLARIGESGSPEVPEAPGELPWISPIGGLGDTLMISGVLKQVVEKNPSRRFNLVARTKYRPILEGHPAIAHIGHPPPGAGFVIFTTNYWEHEDYQRPGKRAYQVLARIFGLTPPVEERLYVPWEFQDDPVLIKLIPWKERNILICQSSDSPRKQMSLERWEILVEMLARKGLGVFQVGRIKDPYVRGAYSLMGLTSSRQLISLVRHFDAVVTGDNFLMHAAQLCGVPAVVLWGPTSHRVYGYAGQTHLQARTECEYSGGCIGSGDGGHLYQIPCPRGPAHCLDELPLEDIYASVTGRLTGGGGGS